MKRGKQLIRNERVHLWMMPGLRFGISLIVPQPSPGAEFRYTSGFWFGPLLGSIGWLRKKHPQCLFCGQRHAPMHSERYYR